MVKLDDLLEYVEYAGGVGLDVWAMRNAVKTGTNLNMDNLRVECSYICKKIYYVVLVLNAKIGDWEKIASGEAGHSPARFSLCGRRGDGDRLFEIITKLRFLGIGLSMSIYHEEWEDVYIDGSLIGRDLRASWMNTPLNDCGPLD